jgi:hypothetical protein
MWQIEPSTQWQKDQKWYEKKRPNELAAVLANLSRYMKYLKASKTSKCLEAGFLHHEPGGVVALDQKGFAGNLQETRLYIFAVDATKTVHLITIGSKDEQHADIEFCKSFVEQLRSGECQTP